MGCVLHPVPVLASKPNTVITEEQLGEVDRLNNMIVCNLLGGRISDEVFLRTEKA